MKKLLIVFVAICLPALVLGQMKQDTKLPSFSQVGTKPYSNLILGFINPDKLTMNHTFSMSYMGMGNGGMMMNSYMNTINYQISNPLFLRFNLGIMNTPYNSFNNPALNNTRFFGGAQLFYRPSDNTMIKLGFDIRPGYYRPGYYGPGFYNNEFDW